MLVKINRNTIRKNPRFRQPYIIPGRTVTYKTIKTSTLVQREETYIVSGNEEKLISYNETSKELNKDINTTIEQPYQKVYEINSQYWLFEYEHINRVNCLHCKQEVDFNDIGDEYIEYSEDDYCQKINICPNCGQEKCINVTYEKLDDVLKEMGLS